MYIYLYMYIFTSFLCVLIVSKVEIHSIVLFDIGICIFDSLWRSTVNAGLNVILKDIDKSKT